MNKYTLKHKSLSLMLSVMLTTTSFAGISYAEADVDLIHNTETVEMDIQEDDTENVILSDDDLIASYTDDGSIMSDEDFFGVYDSQTETWTNPGKFDYDKYPDMQSVKDAVMQGDYELAREECMNYYKEKYQSYTFDSYTITNTTYLGAELIKENVYVDPHTGTTPLGIMTFPGEEPERIPSNYTELNLIDYSSMLTSEAGLFTVYLMGIKKDGTAFQLDGKDTPGGMIPVIEITQKGVTTTYPAVADVYISPSENGLTRYGDKDDDEYKRLLIEESKSSVKSPIAIDANTKRTMIKFDLSGVDADSAIMDAKLKIFGWNYGTGTDGKVVVCNIKDVSWNEENATWYMTGTDGTTTAEHAAFSNDGLQYLTYVSSTPVYETVGDKSFWAYAYRYGEEICRFTFMHEYLVPVCVNDSENYLHYGKVLLRQLIGYLNQWGTIPIHGRTLDAYCRNTVNPKWMGLLLAKTNIITPDIWSAHMKFHWKELEEHAKRYENGVANFVSEEGNWLTYRIQGYVMMLAFFPEYSDFDRYFDWLNIWEEKVFMTSFNSDGSCTEVPDAYGVGSVMSQQMRIDNPFINAKLDVRLINDERKEILKNCLKFFMRQHMPDNLDPRIGDSSGSASQNEIWTGYARRYNDPEMLYMATQGKEAIEAKPRISSFKYPDMGYYVMRSGFLPDSLYLYTDNDGRVSGHTHTDDLAVIVKAYGNNLLTDQAYTSYNWNTGTNLAETQWHNTVEFDNKTGNTSKTSVGSSYRFEANGGYDNATLSTHLYDKKTKVNHTRNILFVKPGYWIVNDYLVPAGSKEDVHTYKQYWHMRPTANMTLDELTGIGRSNFNAEANIQVATAKTDDITAAVIPSYYSYGTGSLVNSKRLVYEQNISGNAAFDTVLYPEKSGSKGNLSVEKLPLENVSDDGVTAMNIIIEDQATDMSVDADYYFVHDNTQKQTRSFGRYTTDGRMAYVERNSENQKLSRIFVQDATDITQNSNKKALFKALTQISEFSANISDKQIDIDSSVNIDLSKVTFYVDNPTTIESVFFNGEEVSFNTSGHYVYFGVLPIINDEAVDSGNGGSGSSGNSRPGTPSHGSSGSSSSGGSGGGSSGSGGGFVPPVNTPENNISSAFKNELDAHWGKDELYPMVEDGILKGLSDETLGLDIVIDRAQFTALLCRALGIAEKEYSGQFEDVKASDWFSGYIQSAYDMGLINGMSDTSFAPYENLTREQMAKILVLAHEKNAEAAVVEEDDMYSDDTLISDWSKEFVYKARRYGIMVGDTQNNFRPNHTSTRAEAAVALSRIK